MLPRRLTPATLEGAGIGAFTVHWTLAHEHPVSDEELMARTYAWAERKRQFSPHQIRLAAKILREKVWVAA